jgi:hypothetical protein
MGMIEEKYKQEFPAFFFEIHDVNQPGNWFKGMLLQVHVIKFKRAVENKDLRQLWISLHGGIRRYLLVYARGLL